MEPIWEETERGLAIAHAAVTMAGSETLGVIRLATAVSLLTSPIQRERERGKMMAREWKKFFACEKKPE